MDTSDFAEFLKQYHLALREITNGRPELYKKLSSRREDVTLANPFAPFGPVSRGWAQVAETLERAASNYADGEVMGFENVSRYLTADLAYIVEVERYRARIGGRDEPTSVALRVTSVLRREDGAWRIVHRHADPITSARPAASLLQE
jgi:ketosteroid isomerase-like protein